MMALLELAKDLGLGHTQSYAVTTAAPTRKILDSLNAKDLTLPNGLHPEEPLYKLGTVLDRIIHFKTLG